MRKSKSDYPPNWPALAEETKQAAGWKCIRCNHPNDPEHGYTLTVHHLDMDPANNAWWNRAALCQRCHLRIQAKVIMERVWMFEHSPWFRPYVAGYYAHVYGLPEDLESVTRYQGALIALGQGLLNRDDVISLTALQPSLNRSG